MLKDKYMKVFLHNKRVELLLNIEREPKNITELSRETNFTQNNTSKTLDRFTSMGLVEKEEKGRNTVYRITKNGEKIRDDFRKIKEIMKKCKKDC